METPPTPRPSAAAGTAVDRPRRGTAARPRGGSAARRLALPAALAVTVLFSACQADAPATSTPASSTPTSGATSAAASPTQPTPSPSASSVPATPRPSETPATRKPSSPAADTTIAVVIADGKVSPNAENVRVKEGETVQVTITSDVDESIHVHGYDQTAEASPGKPGAVTFTADVKGVFEIETHESAKLVAKLIVS